MIEHDASASGSQERSVRRTGMYRVRQNRTFALGCLGVALVLAIFFWRTIAIVGCYSLARFSDSDERVSLATSTLARLGAASVPALARVIEEKDLRGGTAASAALGEIAHASSLSQATVRELLVHPSERVRSLAAATLSQLRDPAALPVLVDALGASDPEARFMAASTLSTAHVARLEASVADPSSVFKRMFCVLAEAAAIDGSTPGGAAMRDLGRDGLERLHPGASVNAELRHSLLEKGATDLYLEARARKGEFFSGY